MARATLSWRKYSAYAIRWHGCHIQTHIKYIGKRALAEGEYLQCLDNFRDIDAWNEELRGVLQVTKRGPGYIETKWHERLNRCQKCLMSLTELVDSNLAARRDDRRWTGGRGIGGPLPGRTRKSSEKSSLGDSHSRTALKTFLLSKARNGPLDERWYG